MARPLRIEFAGALYHVTSRGDRQEKDNGVRSMIYDTIIVQYLVRSISACCESDRR